ncbi:MAG TPA: DUF481 domain-containing protein [Candidatus Limnocylindrales bacterium]|nr:DUF481 domain-containing protein [Candidatus Limnocylindrales bacterium]
MIGHRGIAAAFVGLLLVAPPAHADRLVAGGTTLNGKVTSVTTAGVEFQLEFAKDPFLVPWKNIEDLSTESTYHVLYGDEGAADSQIRSYHDGQLLVGDIAVDPKVLVSATVQTGETPGLRESVRSAMRYWHGSFDFGLNVQQATNDTFGVFFAIHTLRAKGPTRLIMGADYRYANENPPDEDKRSTKDSAAAIVRGEYDITKNIFAYASTDALYDSIQNLSLRAVPKLGAGYVIWQREPKENVRDFFQVEAGAGWVYEKYIENDPKPDDDYFTIALGAAAAALLPRAITVDWRFDYLPNVTDFSDYVIRTGAGLSALVIEPLSLRIGITDVYDSTPSGDSDKNSLNLDTTLSVGW